MPDVGDHYRPSDGARGDEARDAGARDPGTPESDAPDPDQHGPGVYRVVGATDEVALLRVTDGDGRRVHTGELRHVSRDALDAEFEPAEDPDAGLSPVRTVRNLLSGIYWDFRKFL